MQSVRTVRASNYEDKIKSAQIGHEAMNKIKNTRIQLSIPIDNINDPNETGIIGSQYTAITFQRSDLSAALTATNPNFSAVFVELLKKLKIKQGDTIAIGLDGSYPGLNIALYSAIRVLGIKPIIVTTASSAMWGANIPDLTWLDMEGIFYRDNFFNFKSDIASLGGEDDLGRGFSPEARTQLINAMQRNQIEMINSDSFTSDIQTRMSFYSSKGQFKAFINIGKSVADIGVNRINYPNGLINNMAHKTDVNNVIAQMLLRKIPVINISDVNRIATKYGLPVAPVPMPTLGKSKLFMEKRFSQTLAIIITFVIIVILYLVIQYDFEYYLSKNRRKNEK
jgi:poly-gamma-glutamate system protein